MKIKFLTCLSGALKTYAIDEVADFDENEAQALIEKGFAEPLEASETKAKKAKSSKQEAKPNDTEQETQSQESQGQDHEA